MRRIGILTAVVAALGLLTSAWASGSALDDLDQGLRDLVSASSPAVVTIQATSRRGIPRGLEKFGRRGDSELSRRALPEGSEGSRARPDDPKSRLPSWHNHGSGFLLSLAEEEAAGAAYVVTTIDVVDDKATYIKVIFHDGTEARGTLVGTDEQSGISLVRIDDAEGRVGLKLAESDSVSLGSLAVFIGNLMGNRNVASLGIVSAKDVTVGGIPGTVQVTGSFGPGSSGGPVLDVRGTVIGMLLSVSEPRSQWQMRLGPWPDELERPGAPRFRVLPLDLNAISPLGYAVNADEIRWVVGELIDKGEVARGMLGVIISEEMRDGRRLVVVQDVRRGSAAERGGILRGDIIAHINGVAVAGVGDVQRLVRKTPPGEKADIGVVREGREVTLEVTMGPLGGEVIEGETQPQLPNVEVTDNAEGRLHVKLEDISVGELAKVVSSYTQKNFIIGEGVKARVNLQFEYVKDDEASKRAILDAFRSVIKKAGCAWSEQDDGTIVIER